MTHNEKVERLKSLMQEHQVSAEEVASLVRRAYGTVLNWRCGSQEIPEHHLELLEFKLRSQ